MVASSSKSVSAGGGARCSVSSRKSSRCNWRGYQEHKSSTLISPALCSRRGPHQSFTSGPGPLSTIYRFDVTLIVWLPVAVCSVTPSSSFFPFRCAPHPPCLPFTFSCQLMERAVGRGPRLRPRVTFVPKVIYWEWHLVSVMFCVLSVCLYQ